MEKEVDGIEGDIKDWEGVEEMERKRRNRDSVSRTKG